MYDPYGYQICKTADKNVEIVSTKGKQTTP
jgi:hypothetical protein